MAHDRVYSTLCTVCVGRGGGKKREGERERERESERDGGEEWETGGTMGAIRPV